MEDFDKKETELLAQLAEVRKQKSEYAKIKPITILFSVGFNRLRPTSLVNAKLSDYREDIVKKLQSYRSRDYIDNKNYLDKNDYEDFLDWCKTAKNVFTKHSEHFKEDLKKEINKPDYKISLIQFNSKRYFSVEANYQCSMLPKLIKIEGEYNLANKRFHIPYEQGHNLFVVFKDVPKVIWSEEALDAATKLFNVRHKAEEVSKLEDVEDFKQSINGINLFNFQKVGVEFIDATDGNALVAFQTGLGKSPTSLDYIERHKLRALIVCPANLKINWERMIVRFTGEVPFVCTGSTPTNSDILKLLITKPRYVIINYDILSYNADVEFTNVDDNGISHYRQETRYPWVEALCMSKFDIVNCDEIHYICNKKSARSVAVRMLNVIPRRIGLSATPIKNRERELFPILNFIRPDIFDDEADFRNRFEGNPAAINRVLQPIMIRRLRKDVRKDMPKILRIVEWRELSPKAQKIHDRIMDGVITIINKSTKEEMDVMLPNILSMIQRAKHVCALSKARDVADFATTLYDDSEGEDHRKVIVFSQYKDTTYGIGRMLGHEALSFTGDEDKKERMRLVDRFQDEEDVHFLTAGMKSAPEGLDMTAAGYGIFNDLGWAPYIHEQCEGRYYGRLNDEHGAEAFYFVCRNSIEEWIWELLDEKQRLIDASIDGSLDRIKSVSIVKELLDKLKDRGDFRR